MASRNSSNRSGKPAKPAIGTTSAQQRLASQRAAAARARISAAQRRRRLWSVGGSVLAVLAVVATLVIVKVVTNAGNPKSGTKATAASLSVLAKVSNVPLATLNSIGAGAAQTPPTAISAPVLTEDGKPEVLYVGAEYCPYCAAERWAVAVALSRFGTLHGVGETTSSPSDVYPSTATLTFHDATYTSSLLALTAKEIQSNQVVNGQYTTLDKLTSAQNAIVTKYNAAPYVKTGAGSIPFVDIGGKYVISGASYSPQVLHGESHAQIAAALSHAASPIAQSVDGTANLVTAAICSTTGQKPRSVCSSTGVRAGLEKLNATS